ncbi:MAG: hypothetical protein ACOCP1_01925 [Campylobacterales bacterium]
MKKEYDFSKGEKGKFYHPTAKFSIPIYLDKDIEEFVLKIAEKKKSDVSSIVNQILAKDRELAELVAVKP